MDPKLVEGLEELAQLVPVEDDEVSDQLHEVSEAYKRMGLDLPCEDVEEVAEDLEALIEEAEILELTEAEQTELVEFFRRVKRLIRKGARAAGRVAGAVRKFRRGVRKFKRSVGRAYHSGMSASAGRRAPHRDYPKHRRTGKPSVKPKKPVRR